MVWDSIGINGACDSLATSQLPIIGKHFVCQSDIEENNPFLKHLYSKGWRASKKLSEGAAMQGQDDLEEEMETE
jgi:hypothetical protein